MLQNRPQIKGPMRWALLVASAALVLALPGAAAQALSLAPGTYTLHSHDGGNLAPPKYGLRLDGLDGVDSHDFTFDFDGPGASMSMDYAGEGGSLRIYGTAYGGQDIGGGYTDAQLWEIDFTYTSVMTNGDYLDAGPGTGSGNITPLAMAIGSVSAGDPIALVDENGDHSYSFRLALGHRGFVGISGFGWLNHEVAGLDNHVYASDWLFTVEPGGAVPEPGAAALFGLGVLVLRAGVGRRR